MEITCGSFRTFQIRSDRRWAVTYPLFCFIRTSKIKGQINPTVMGIIYGRPKLMYGSIYGGQDSMLYSMDVCSNMK